MSAVVPAVPSVAAWARMATAVAASVSAREGGERGTSLSMRLHARGGRHQLGRCRFVEEAAHPLADEGRRRVANADPRREPPAGDHHQVGAELEQLFEILADD